jgi:hypothetical protein
MNNKLYKIFVFLVSAGIVIILVVAYIAVTESDKVVSEPTATPFPIFSKLENKAEGYNFEYPSDWEPVYVDTGLVLNSPSGKSKVTVTLDGQEPHFKIELGTESDNIGAELVKSTIENTFEITDKQKFNRQEIEKRFEDVLGS